MEIGKEFLTLMVMFKVLSPVMVANPINQRCPKATNILPTLIAIVVYLGNLKPLVSPNPCSGNNPYNKLKRAAGGEIAQSRGQEMEICQLSGHFFSGIPFQFNYRLRKSARTPKFLTYANGVSCYQTEKTGQDSLNRMFILGMGFVGQFLAEELRNEGWIVSGTCTSMKKRNELQERGLDVLLFDANKPEMGTMNTLKSYTHLLVSIPPIMGIGDPMLQHGELLRSTMIDGNLQWLCYLSSTSVYGDCGGACVDEDFLASPTNEMAKLRLVAEQGWLNLAHDFGIKAHVFRLGGIYGPGRRTASFLCSAVDTIIKQGPLSESQKRRVAKQFTSRVHVADICQALKASIRIQLSRYALIISCNKFVIRQPPSCRIEFMILATSNNLLNILSMASRYRTSHYNVTFFRRIYNIVDDDPASRKKVFAYALDLVEKKWPSLVKEITSHERAEPFVQKTTLKGEKRVSNAHMTNELAVQLLYPSYKSGLQSIIDQIENPF
ncbi:protein YeeZ isoform X1 [Gossypium australe]|uniref:Protein YeeZ isoform X1 n=1 Tax=Gossypium australe TaxID=47621 RepID=A0A5B6U8M8_9ROSI|nr:protein YeeZ isoform X1 [Gossypium australe]